MGAAAPRLEPRKDAVLGIVQLAPGLSTGRLRSRAGLCWGTLVYHLERLEREGRIELLRRGRRAFVFPAGAVRAPAFPDELLASRAARAIARAIVDRPRGSIQDVIETTGASPRVAYYHVAALVEAGLVLRGARARYLDLRPTDELEAALRDYAEGAEGA